MNNTNNTAKPAVTYLLQYTIPGFKCTTEIEATSPREAIDAARALLPQDVKFTEAQPKARADQCTHTGWTGSNL